jgi:DNA-directed RNA polymerase specialized sigma subunit
MAKVEDYQQIVLKMELSLKVRSKYSTSELAEMLKRCIRCAFPNNDKEVIAAEFKEEKTVSNDNWNELYSPLRK